MNIHIAQCEFRIGDLAFQTQQVIDVCTSAAAEGADLVLFPELWLPGYPAMDLLYRSDLHSRVGQSIKRIADELNGVCAVAVGYPRPASAELAAHSPELGARPTLYNTLGLIAGGEIIAEHRKCSLPNYEVFDERRYFQIGDGPTVVPFKGRNIGLLVCEDVWIPSIVEATMAAGADCLLVSNGSPYHRGKWSERATELAEVARKHQVPLFYSNSVGGQDDLVFDGDSQAFDAQGQRQARAPMFQPAVLGCELDQGNVKGPNLAEDPDTWGEVYDALVLGTRDYIEKNGFPGVILGLSGGIDSALTQAIAVDALGADRVTAVMMPYHYTSDISKDDAAEQANAQGVEYHVAPIVEPVEALKSQVLPILGDRPLGTTVENLQSRSRGVILMGLSNATGRLVLTTGNKSELAVGYATLYGDMAGGYNVLRDVPKTWVFELAKYRNRLSPVIPERVITRPPSAELAPDQVDTDSLPDYPILDDILDRYLAAHQSPQQIMEAGHAAETVERVVRLVNIAEYKRRQGAVGPRVTPSSFNEDRRVPITQRWH